MGIKKRIFTLGIVSMMLVSLASCGVKNPSIEKALEIYNGANEIINKSNSFDAKYENILEMVMPTQNEQAPDAHGAEDGHTDAATPPPVKPDDLRTTKIDNIKVNQFNGKRISYVESKYIQGTQGETNSTYYFNDRDAVYKSFNNGKWVTETREVFGGQFVPFGKNVYIAHVIKENILDAGVVEDDTSFTVTMQLDNIALFEVAKIYKADSPFDVVTTDIVLELKTTKDYTPISVKCNYNLSFAAMGANLTNKMTDMITYSNFNTAGDVKDPEAN